MIIIILDEMVVATKLPTTYLVSESWVRRRIVQLYGKNSEHLADEQSELVVLGFDERKDWTKQPSPLKDVQESHITFTDERDYTDHGTVEADEDGKKGANMVFKEVWNVVEKRRSQQSIKFVMCDGCNTNT